MSTLPSFPREGLELLAALARNNSTEWFHRHKGEYAELVRDPMLRLVGHVNGELVQLAPHYVNEKKNPLSRPNRDTRFSSDKSPYRTDVSAVWPRSGKDKEAAAGFFLSVGSEGAVIVAGTYMPGTPELGRIRSYLNAHHLAFQKLLSADSVKRRFGSIQGEQLRRMPRGYPESHPAESLLRRKQLHLELRIAPEGVLSPMFAKEVVNSFRIATPVVEAIDHALGN